MQSAENGGFAGRSAVARLQSLLPTSHSRKVMIEALLHAVSYGRLQCVFVTSLRHCMEILSHATLATLTPGFACQGARSKSPLIKRYTHAGKEAAQWESQAEGSSFSVSCKACPAFAQLRHVLNAHILGGKVLNTGSGS